jgi:hypothetical protein
MIGAPLVTKLKAAAAVTDMVGDRISPQVNTADKFPQLVYRSSKGKVSAVNDDGGDVVPYSVTVTCAALSYSAAGALAAAVRAALDEQIEGWGEAIVRSCLIQDETEDEESDPDEPKRIYYSVTQTYQVWAYTGD